MWLWVLRHPPIGGTVLWCPCRRSLSLVVSFLGLGLFRPLVLRIPILIALLLVVCYLWCGFIWFFHVWFWFLLWYFVDFFALCSSVCLWFLPYALHTWLLLTMLCRRLWWRLEMPCRSFFLCFVAMFSSSLRISRWSTILSRWWFFRIIFRSCSIMKFLFRWSIYLLFLFLCRLLWFLPPAIPVVLFQFL